MSSRILTALALGSALLLTAPTYAQKAPALPGSKSTAAVTGGTYQADPGHTLVRWTVDHFGFSPYTGLFGGVTGTLELDPKNPAGAKVDVTIPVAGVATASSALTAHLLRAPKEAGGKPDFFGASPADAKFVSTSVVLGSDGDEAKVTGNLTLNGVTKPVTLDVDFHGAGVGMNKKETVGFQAETTIKRSDFGLDMAIPFVSDEVALDIVAAFVK